MFARRKLLIATRHGKDRVMAPLLEQGLGVFCDNTPDLDTDQFGTFTGEITRVDAPVSAARRKCLLAMEKYGSDLAVASEGSFGMHPVAFWGYADEEILLLIDQANDLEISVGEISCHTNFGGAVVTSKQELLDFADNHMFPSHAMILRAGKDDPDTIVKGITDLDTLTREYFRIAGTKGSAFVETDMRAMFNPTRMKVIEQATQKLIAKVRSLCPKCGCPGFWAGKAIPGRICSQCGLPTRSIKAHVYRCQRCGYDEYREISGQEEPQYCDYCNP